MDALTFFQQKSERKGKENIIEIRDSSEESDDEGEKQTKKHRKGSKVSVCFHVIAQVLNNLFRFQMPGRYYLATK